MKEKASYKILLALVRILLFIGGMSLLVANSSWEVGLAVFLLFWSDNISNSFRRM